MKKGQLIAYSGCTGTQCFGAHLHVDAEVNHGLADVYPYLFGIWDEKGKPIKSEQLNANELYKNTDSWERVINGKLPYIASQTLPILKKPSLTDTSIGTIKTGLLFEIDRWCNLPNGDVWGRLYNKPWHWIGLCLSGHWYVEGSHVFGRLYELKPSQVYTTTEAIQGYQMPRWTGKYTRVMPNQNTFVAIKRFDDEDGNIFALSDGGDWYCLKDTQSGWHVKGGFPTKGKENYKLYSGQTLIKQGSYYAMMKAYKNTKDARLYYQGDKLA